MWQLARSGAAVGRSVGVTVVLVAVGILVYAVVTLRKRGRHGR